MRRQKNVSPVSRAILLGGLLCVSAVAWADAFPNRPMRFIVPYPPGGGTDLVARVLGRHLGERWGQSVVIDNRPGGNAVIGTEQAARAAPDGHTFVMMNSSFIVLPLLQKNLRFKPAADLAPVIHVAESPNIVVTRNSLPVSSLGDLLALAKRNSAPLNFAEGGFGGPSHLAAELFNYVSGTRMSRISYKGTGPATIDLLGGHVDLMFASITGVLPHARSGKLRALAVTSLQRSPAIPEVPTARESGVKDYVFVSWYGVMVPSGTPKPIVGRLEIELRGILQMDEVRKTLAAEGGEVTANDSRTFADYIRSETRQWARVIGEMHIRPEQ